MSPRSPSPPSRRPRSPRAAALLLPLVLHGCFTMGLWGFELEEDQGPFTAETTFAYDPETEWSWSKLGLRVLLTPFTLALDCLTCPIQAICVCDDGEGEQSDHCRR